MSNPLLQKYEELYGPKKEESNKVEIEGKIKLTEELKSIPSSTSVATISTGTGITASNYYTASNSTVTTRPVISYDLESANDSFLQIAEKVKSKDAVVTSVTMNRDYLRTTISFEVILYDSP